MYVHDGLDEGLEVPMRNSRFMPILATAFGSLVLVTLLGGQQSPDCIPVNPAETGCVDAIDCEGFPHAMCVGQWSCMGGQCVWECEPECVDEGEIGSSMMTPMECCPGLEMISVATWDPELGLCGMATDIFLCSKCGNGTCETDWENPCNCPDDCEKDPADPKALCAATGGEWNYCGSGCGPWSCGEPVQMICPGVCISLCECGGGMGWDPQEGCRTCSCDEWFATWKSLLSIVTQCTAPDDCVSVPGTSCGCTRNLVVNKDMDLWLFWKVAEWMGNDGCSPFFSTCDCPPVDGYACIEGHCAWNYL